MITVYLKPICFRTPGSERPWTWSYVIRTATQKLKSDAGVDIEYSNRMLANKKWYESLLHAVNNVSLEMCEEHGKKIEVICPLKLLVEQMNKRFPASDSALYAETSIQVLDTIKRMKALGVDFSFKVGQAPPWADKDMLITAAVRNNLPVT